MGKMKQNTLETVTTTITQPFLDKALEVRASERKLNPQITIGFAAKTPKFAAARKHTVVYEK